MWPCSQVQCMYNTLTVVIIITFHRVTANPASNLTLLCMYVCVTLRNAIKVVGVLRGTCRRQTFCQIFHMVGRTLVWTKKTTKKEVGALLHYVNETSSHQLSGS